MQFTDNSGQAWTCRVDWAAIRRSSAAGVDLSITEEFLGDFYRGSVKLVDALWAIVGPQATALTITRETFEKNVSGETIEAARDALIAGVLDFFPKGRGALVIAARQDVEEQLANLAKLAGSSADSPDSSESTPDH